MILEPKVKFNESTHTYHIGDTKAVSVNGVIKLFKEEYDEDYWLAYKALQAILPNFRELKLAKKYKYPQSVIPPRSFLDELRGMVEDSRFNSAVEVVAAEWKASQTNGTAFHNMMEESHYDRGYVINPWNRKEYVCKKYEKLYDNQSIVEDLSDLEDGCYPELLVWNEELGITGQADLVFIETIDGVRYVDIDDYKTNKKKPTKSKFRSMHFPIAHLYDDKINTYALQMSFYQRLLEFKGFTPRHTALTHYKDYDPTKGSRIDLPYLKEEVDLMIETFQLLTYSGQ